MGRKTANFQHDLRSQTQRVAHKFGGHSKLAKILGLAPSTVYRWEYPREKRGTDGVIPSYHWKAIHAAARLEGVLLTQHDLDPRRLDPDQLHPSLMPQVY